MNNVRLVFTLRKIVSKLGSNGQNLLKANVLNRIRFSHSENHAKYGFDEALAPASAS